MVNKRIAVIPARGGSKRIVGKNIIEFCGKPLISWTIEAAIRSKLFDRVIVSTDDPRIADISKSFGAEVPFLRSEYCGDFAAVSDATLSAVLQASDYWSEDYDIVVQLMANCPIRTAQDIQKAVSAFECKNREFQISCFKMGWMNPWWAAKLNRNMEPQKIFPEEMKKRSQDLPDLYCPTGAIWISKFDNLLHEKTFYGTKHFYEPISWISAIDIDDYDDLRFAEIAKNVY